MKRLKFILGAILISGFALTSCSDDDSDSNQEQQASIEGKWFYAKQGFSAAGVDNLQNYDGHEAGCTKDNFVLDAAAGSWKEYDYASTTCDETVVTSTYTRNGNSITFGTGPDAETYEIQSVTDSSLRIRQLESTTGGQNIYYVETYTRN